ncbi:zf-TFIIB domain-containing protein [Hyalangium gracile]|uniref:zf-TFIIB domain-containing protein n=1 Tax=Hyalangium gracile TaxID=394092 RepID=UPI001CCB802A|nr:zf-TFIIB domain-containing protein [Hyalangium gracile]
MNTCPFCPGRLYPTFTNSLPREKCGKCDSIWFEGEALANLVGIQAANALVEKTKGKPGKCKHCSASLSYVAQCTRCHHDAPTCPQCGTAPLAVAVVDGVRVDVCTGCKGMALDKDGLTQLQKIVAERRPAKPVTKPKEEPKNLTKAPCAACQRKLLLKYAFVYDSKIYCGSCAPPGAAPFNVDLAKASPTLAPSLGTYLTGDEDLTADAVSVGISILFKVAASRLMR